MHILSLFTKYTLIIGILLITVGLLSRETLLFWGIVQVRSAESKMEATAGATRKVEYDQKCRQKSGAAVQLTQLRFTSDTEYQIEVVCGFFANDPIIVEQFTLPPFVKKHPGQSGFVAQTNNISGVVLSVYGRKSGIVLNDEKIKITQGVPEFTGKQPQATCQGFGYMCCNAETQAGVDSLFTQVLDCPQQCYSSCEPRPVVLKFISDPNPDLKTRTALVSKSTPITFYYVVDPGKGAQSSSVLEFGDGQSQTFTDTEGNLSHQYQCNQPQCQYTAKLTVTDANGMTSAATPVSIITVIVR